MRGIVESGQPGGADITSGGAQIHIGGNVTGQVAIGDFVYQAQAPGGIINQIMVPEPIRALPRPIDLRPRLSKDSVPRDSIVEAALAATADGPVQLVAGDGWGKTSVVAQLVHRGEVESSRDGIAVIPAWGLPVDDIEQAIFEAFYACTLPDTVMKATQGQFRTAFADIEATIVIDDLDVARQHVDRITDACPGCVLISSAATQTMWSGGQVLDIGPMSTAEAIELFSRRLGRPIATSETDAVARFITGIAAYPLGIVSAAAAVRRGGAAIESLLQLAGAPDPVGAIREHLASTFTLAEARILSTLAAVDGAPLPPEAVGAAAGVDAAGDVLETLRNDGVLQAASPRYRLQAATADDFGVDGSGASVTQGLARWCRNEPDATKVAAAAPAIIKAMNGAMDAGRQDDAALLGRSADAAVSLSGRWGLWEELTNGVSQAATAAGDVFTEAWALHQAGSRSLALGELDAAHRSLSAAADIRRRIGDVDGLAATEHNLGMVSPPPPAIPPQRPPAPPPQKSGFPGWAWAMIVVGVAVIAAVAWFVVTQTGDEPTVVTTTVVAGGTLEVTVDVIEILDVPPGEAASAETEVFNSGPGSLEVTDIRLEPDGPLDADSECGFLDPGESCLVTVTFAPADAGDFRSNVVIEHTGSNSPATVPVIASSVDPPSAFVSVDPVNLDFGSVPAGGRSERPLTVSNAGDLDVRIDSAAAEPGNFAASQACGDLSPGESCDITVTFTATRPGTFEGRLFVEHTGDNPPFEITLTAFVPEPANLTVNIVEVLPIDPKATNEAFLAVPVQIELTNIGGTPTDEPFVYRFETIRPNDDTFPWIPAFTPSGDQARFFFDGSIGAGETVQVTAIIGFPTSQYKPGSFTDIRVEVDSCFGEEFIASPPCRVDESNEEDNMSEEFRFQITVPGER